jgi:hypothetical protein
MCIVVWVASGKILIACKMIDSAREMARSRIRTQHPKFDEAAVRG